ncbi:hypothetical protein [Methylobacterium oryzae]|uniref:hypothetical protein n=1 Tax=Methylobacterium oryzae TaxID=334852 RepID=UPI002F35EEDC
MLARYGVEVTYYDPTVGTGIAALMRPNTRAVLVEAPGSQSFEMVRRYRAVEAAAEAAAAPFLGRLGPVGGA